MSLREFLEEMEERREVIRITEPLSTRFEIPLVMKSLEGGPIPIFENVEGYEGVTIVGNVCGTRDRLCLALNVSREELYNRLIDASRNLKPPSVVSNSPVTEVIEEPDLRSIPILTHYEGDAGAYITSAVISAKSPDGSVENVSIHRLLVLDERHLAIRLVPRHLYKLWSMAKGEGKDLDIAIAVGVHPAVSLAAASSPPFGVNEFWIANALLDGKLRLIKCRKVDAYAPADAELVLEGRISRDREATEGPLVDITGTYDIKRSQPVVEVINVMHRKGYIYQALLPGGAEHRLLMGLPREAAIYEAVSRVVPKVRAVNLSIGGCGWLHAIISIEKQTDGDAKNAILSAFSAHPSLKHVVVVDTDVDVFNLDDVEWAIATRFQADEDLVILRNVRGSSLDPSADQERAITSKMGIDATRPLSKPREGFERAEIPRSGRAEDIIDKLMESLGDPDSF